MTLYTLLTGFDMHISQLFTIKTLIETAPTVVYHRKRE